MQGLEIDTNAKSQTQASISYECIMCFLASCSFMMSSLCVLKEICSHCPQSNPQMMTSHVSITVVLQKTLRPSALRSSLQKQKGCNQTMPRLWLKHWVDYSLSLTCSFLKRMASCTVSTWSTIHTFSNLLQGLPCTLNVHQLQHHNQIKSKTKKRKENSPERDDPSLRAGEWTWRLCRPSANGRTRNSDFLGAV